MSLAPVLEAVRPVLRHAAARWSVADRRALAERGRLAVVVSVGARYGVAVVCRRDGAIETLWRERPTAALVRAVATWVHAGCLTLDPRAALTAVEAVQAGRASFWVTVRPEGDEAVCCLAPADRPGDLVELFRVGGA